MVDDTIERTPKKYLVRLRPGNQVHELVTFVPIAANVLSIFNPEGLAKTGNIYSERLDISRLMGELFVNRFYINLHTDILDTPGG